jgi:hypothetical protein
MQSTKALLGRAVPGLLTLCTILLAIAPNASATSTPLLFGVNASGTVDGGQIDQNCAGNNGTTGDIAATFSCGAAGFGSVTATVAFGAAFIKAEADNINAGVVGSVNFFVQGTIGGNSPSGTMTWTDTGISASGGGDVFLTIFTRGGPFGTFSVPVGSACFGGPGVTLAGCGAATSMNANAPVTNGEPIELLFQANCGNKFQTIEVCELSDPMSLSLTNGLTFNSNVPNLFAPGPSTTPEPSSLLLLGSGLLSFSWLRKRLSAKA